MPGFVYPNDTVVSIICSVNSTFGRCASIASVHAQKISAELSYLLVTWVGLVNLKTTLNRPQGSP